ncbi:Hypothetical_protein [Hexamita inflata]|uniref:Hypothetical_protein n=1 Tax=Hexamita inflata TaxID=28002 RepID=A0AA86PDY7_9EUKA|nr:Hypothetical protein HINF_LOCUS24508 [Hexamita inflata]
MITLKIVAVVQQLFNPVNKIKKLYQHLLITYIIQFIEIYQQTSQSSKYIPNDSCRIDITCQLPVTSCSCMNDFYLLAVSTILQNLHDQCVFLLKREPYFGLYGKVSQVHKVPSLNQQNRKINDEQKIDFQSLGT